MTILSECMLNCFSCIRLFVTLWNTACQAPLSMKFSRQEYWIGLPCPLPSDLPDPGIKPILLISPALAGWFFNTSDNWEALTNNQLSSVQLPSRVWLFVTPWTAACQASLSITNSWSLLKLMSIELVMPSNLLILCCPCLLLASIFPTIRVFSNESVLCIR